MIIVDLILNIIFLFFPTFILMVYFILKLKETSKKIKYYENLLGIQVNVADNCLSSVALGGGVVIGDKDLLKKITLPIK